MCFQSPIATKKPDITFYEIGSQTVSNELQSLNIAVPLGLFDTDYYYTTLWGIQEAVKYARKVYPFPKYEAEQTDCDDFAILMKGLMSAEFGINAFGVALGNTPLGYHAFGVSRTNDRWVFIEPQTGGVFEINDMSKNYSCDRTII